MAHSRQLAPYFKPSLPFTGPIRGSLHDGFMVIISGIVLPTCDRFQIDFQCGSCPYPHADIGFHFNPRFEEGGCVVCNTFESQKWGREERKYEMPFFKGYPFEIRVLVKDDSFLVAVNGNPFVQYKHRIPFSRVNYLSVSGGAEVEIISFQDNAPLGAWSARAAGITNAAFPVHSPILDQHIGLVYTMRGDRSKLHDFSYMCEIISPFLSVRDQMLLSHLHNTSRKLTSLMNMLTRTGPSLLPSPVGQIHASSAGDSVLITAAQAPVPYHTSIVGGLYPSRSLTITGTIPLDAVRFEVNLKWGEHVAFHLNPRFSEKTIVRNSQLNQCWGPEERGLPSGMPLSCGQSFTIWILCEAHCFTVTVNGHHQFAYNHRVSNLQQIDRLEVEGDVILTCVQV